MFMVRLPNRVSIHQAPATPDAPNTHRPYSKPHTGPTESKMATRYDVR